MKVDLLLVSTTHFGFFFGERLIIPHQLTLIGIFISKYSYLSSSYRINDTVQELNSFFFSFSIDVDISLFSKN